MEYDSPEYFVTTDQSRFDFSFVHRSLQSTRWAKGRPEAVILESFMNSLCFGLFCKASSKQIGFVRVVTDKVVASVIDDVFVEEPYRRKGLGTWLMSCVVSHPYVFQTKSRLKTTDAHRFYEKFGFTTGEAMERRPGPPQNPNKPPERTRTAAA